MKDSNTDNNKIKDNKTSSDKPKIAVALEYTPGEQAPKILATIIIQEERDSRWKILL